MADQAATKFDFVVKPMGENREALELSRLFTAEDYELIRWGHFPKLPPNSWPDSWFAYFEDDWLYLHRAPNGSCHYMAKFAPNDPAGSTYSIVEAWGEADPAHGLLAVASDGLDITIEEVLLNSNRFLLARRRLQQEEKVGKDDVYLRLMDKLIGTYLLKDPSGNWQVVDTPGQDEKGQLLQRLVTMLANPEPHPLRYRACALLGLFNYQPAEEVLSQVCTSDLDSTVREEAVKAISQLSFESDATFEILVAVLKYDPTRAVRQAAVSALAQTLNPLIIKPLTEVIGDRDGQVQKVAVATLRNFEPELVGTALIETLFTAEEERASSLEWAFYWLDLTPVIPRLLEGLSNAATQIVIRACYALGYCWIYSGDETLQDEVVSSITGLLKASDARVRKAAANALFRIKDPRAVKPLLELLEVEGDTEVSYAILETLGVLEEPNTIPALLKVVNNANSSTDLRNLAAAWLTNKGVAEVFDSLIELLSHKEPITRANAARCLSLLKEVRAVEPLTGALSDSDSGVQYWACEGLAKLGDTRVLGELKKLQQSCGEARWLDLSIEEAAARAIKHLEEIEKGELEE